VFDFVVYIGFILVTTMITPLLSFRMMRKGIDGVKKYGWGKFPKGFVDSYYGSSSFELIFVGLITISLWALVIYDFIFNGFNAIIVYLS